MWFKSKFGESRRPSIVMLTEKRAHKVAEHHSGLHLYFDQPWHFNIGHALWDGLYAGWVALVQLGLADRDKFGVIADVGETREPADTVFATFGGGAYHTEARSPRRAAAGAAPRWG